jgi:hypothetical protein
LNYYQIEPLNKEKENIFSYLKEISTLRDLKEGVIANPIKQKLKSIFVEVSMTKVAIPTGLLSPFMLQKKFKYTPTKIEITQDAVTGTKKQEVILEDPNMFD